MVGHDRGLHQVVPHLIKKGGGHWTPIPKEARHGGSVYPHHNHTIDGERFDSSGYDDGPLPRMAAPQLDIGLLFEQRCARQGVRGGGWQ
jgi:hypothetical protein